jgi:hypothetical protein
LVADAQKLVDGTKRVWDGIVATMTLQAATYHFYFIGDGNGSSA